MTKQEYLICPICAAQTKDYFSTSGNLITDVRCTNRKCFFSSNYVPINTWDRFMHMVERCASLEAENAKLKEALEKAAEYITEINDWCPYADAGCPYMDKIDHQQCWLDWLRGAK